MKFGLKETTISQINQVFSIYPQVKSVIIYGSRAKGNYRKGSDIDLTLIGEELTLHFVHKIELDLDDLLLPYTFDLSVFQDINNPDLLDHIQRVGIEFFKQVKIACD